jgi:hypothetical protein
VTLCEFKKPRLAVSSNKVYGTKKESLSRFQELCPEKLAFAERERLTLCLPDPDSISRASRENLDDLFDSHILREQVNSDTTVTIEFNH